MKRDREQNVILNKCLLQAVDMGLEIENDRFEPEDNVITSYKHI